MVSLNLLKCVFQKGGKVVQRTVKATTPKLLQARVAKVHEKPGEILKMANAKPRTIKIESVPTQQKIDKMLDVGKYDGVEGIYDRKKCADALYAFTKGTPIEHVKTESVKTLDAINNMHRIDFIDKMRMAEATGELPKDVLARRKEIIEAFDTHTDFDERLAREFSKLSLKTIPGKTNDFIELGLKTIPGKTNDFIELGLKTIKKDKLNLFS